jgi:acetate kinase
MSILVLNCGSSSIKFAVIEPSGGERLLEGSAEDLGGAGRGSLRWRAGKESGSGELAGARHEDALRSISDLLRRDEGLADAIRGVGHRVVHGGEAFAGSERIDAAVLARIEALAGLAPLHQPFNLLGIRAMQALFPSLPQVAVFDTAFHQTMPERAYLYAVPQALYREHGVRRYGFHGISHRYVAGEATRLLDLDPAHSALITAHLGNGCSATAVLDGRSVDTSMGLSPLEGLVMGTRSGDVDPGLHEFLAERLDLDVAGVTALLNRESGLLGLSGLSNDMRRLTEAAEGGHRHAALAVELFCYRLAKHLAALVVPLGRLDALVFTGGIGENAVAIRARVLGLLEHLGLRLDEVRNAEHGARSGGVITSDDPPVAAVVATDEELLIASDTAALIQEDPERGR